MIKFMSVIFIILIVAFSAFHSARRHSPEIREASCVSHVSVEHEKRSEYLSQADSAHTHRNTEVPI